MNQKTELLKKELKLKRYGLCFEFALKVIEDDVDASELRKHFHLLSRVTCYADIYLDSLNLNQKKQVLLTFGQFFDSVKTEWNELQFLKKCLSYGYSLNSPCFDPESIPALMAFCSLADELEFSNELKDFTLEIVEASIAKNEAADSTSVLKSSEQEGTAAIKFLDVFITKTSIKFDYNRSEKLAYLASLERMLSITDDLIDGKIDYQENNMRCKTGARYYITLGSQLAAHFTKNLFTYGFTLIIHSISFLKQMIQLEWSHKRKVV